MKKQIVVFLSLLLAYAIITFAVVVFGLEQLVPGQGISPEVAAIPRWILGLSNAAIVIVLYGLFGGLGLFFAKRQGLPGIFREKSTLRELFWMPLGIGIIVGFLLVLGDGLFSNLGNVPGFPHPPFPLSILASAAAGIGEEVMFRMFILGFWALIVSFVLSKWTATRTALWIANIIAAFLFAASHIPSAMILLGATSPNSLPPSVLAELFVLNGILGIIAGERYIRDGLVAAAGVHFWADVVWHVIFPLIRG